MKITELKLPETIQKALLEMGYEDFTAIQEMTLPALLNGEDVIAEAPTGTGKTAAYCLPMLTRIDATNPAVQALVVCPTRELAIQVVEEIHKFSKYTKGIRYAAIYGGQKINNQLRQLKNLPQILVGCPGRLNDLIERKAISLSKVGYLVLDECDEMLEMGFIRDVNKIIEKVTSPHQTALFSATISPEIKKVAARYLDSAAKRVTIKRTPTQENQIAQKYVLVSEEKKKQAIVDLLTSLSFARAFVFCRTKHKVMQIAKLLTKSTRHAVVMLQGNLSQNKRDQAMKAFRDYDANVMVATDIAARGIDVNDVDLVVNYDIPEEDEFYLHRIGRTGRVDKNGTSYTFMTKSELPLTKKYEAMTHCPIEQYVINKGDVMKKYLENLKLDDDLSAEKKAIEEVCLTLSAKAGHQVTPEDLAAALLKEKLAEPSSPIADEKDRSFRHDESIERNKERKRFETDPNNQRFFINIGFEDGADEEKVKSFVMKFCKGLELDDFADVYLKGTFSFFEVPKDVTSDIVHNLEGTHFGEKLIHVEKTERPEGGAEKKDKPFKKFDHHDSYHHDSGHGYHRDFHHSDRPHGDFRKSSHYDKKH
jgi:ATP-dependent RNA helicase DeaD